MHHDRAEFALRFVMTANAIPRSAGRFASQKVMATCALARFGWRAGAAVDRRYDAGMAFAAARSIWRFKCAALDIVTIRASYRVRAVDVRAMARTFEHIAPRPFFSGNLVGVASAMQLRLTKHILHHNKC